MELSIIDPCPARTDCAHPMQRDWVAITTGIANGDSVFFEFYYEECFAMMYAEARRITSCDESLGLDLVHDGMLKAMRCMKRLDNIAEVRAWTRVVIRSVVYDFLRKRVRERRLHEDVAVAAELRATDRCIEDEARMLWIEEQLQQEPAELRSIIAYRYRFGWTLRQIGERLGMKTGAVDGRIRRALDRLRNSAEEQFDDEK